MLPSFPFVPANAVFMVILLPISLSVNKTCKILNGYDKLVTELRDVLPPLTVQVLWTSPAPKRRRGAAGFAHNTVLL